MEVCIIIRLTCLLSVAVGGTSTLILNCWVVREHWMGVNVEGLAVSWKCPFCHVLQHGNYHRISGWVQAFFAIRLPRSGTVCTTSEFSCEERGKPQKSSRCTVSEPGLESGIIRIQGKSSQHPAAAGMRSLLGMTVSLVSYQFISWRRNCLIVRF